MKYSPCIHAYIDYCSCSELFTRPELFSPWCRSEAALQVHPKHSATPWRIPTVKLRHHNNSNLYLKDCLSLDNCITLQPSCMVMMGLPPIVPNIPLCPLLLHWLWCPQGCFSQFSHSSLPQPLYSIFHPALNMSLQRHHQCGWWAQLCPVVGVFWSRLEPSGTSSVQHGQTLASPHRGHPWSPPLSTSWHLHPIQINWPQ